MHAPVSPTRPHTERWAYRRLYRDDIFSLATRLFPILRRPGAQILGRAVAWSYAVTQHAIRRIVRENLSLLQPAPATDRDAIAVFVNFGATIADYVAVGAMPERKAAALCAEHWGVDHLKTATAGGRGVILATGHFSFFEYGAVVLSQMGHKVTIATLPEPSRELTDWRAAWRARWETETIAVGSDSFSSLQVARALDEGRCMAMLADRPIAEHGQPVDLPNGRTLFSTSPALLSWLTGCEILPVVVIRLPGGRYRIVAKPPLRARRPGHGRRDEEIARCTQELAASLFAEICQHPHQWYQFVPVGL